MSEHVMVDQQDRVDPAAEGLDITVRTGSASGRTLLSAFDAALHRAGVADLNLLTLSSVIPPNSRIRMIDTPLPGGHGDLLFCVRAEAYAEHPGDFAWAGLGWCVDETGGGLFVEHHGGSQQTVTEQIELSLADMKAIRGGGYGEVHMALASAHCLDLPACALVIAAYRVASWQESAAVDEPVETAGSTVGPDAEGGDPADADVVAAMVPASAVQPADPWGEPVGGPDCCQTAAPVPAAAPVVSSRPARVGVQNRISVTVEKEVDYMTARSFWKLYRETFGGLETEAVARQVLHESEFLEEMLDSRVLKYVAWDEDGEAIGMTTLTSDLTTVPWISPGYFAHHYPEHHARGALYYLGFTLVHESQRQARVFHAMIERVMELMVAEHAVAAWDMCLYNDDRRLGGNAARLLGRLADVTIAPVDRQTYYVGICHGAHGSATPG